MKQVFIYGGCTSRDAVEYYPDHGLELLDYVARQSLVSAFNPSNLNLWDFSPIRSNFQRRMTRGDVKSTLPTKLQEHANKIDLIVWDLMIERLGYRRAQGGGYVTYNNATQEYIKNPKTLGTRTRFGTEAHYDFWSRALDQFVALLKDLGLHNKIVLNGTPWAVQDKHGHPADYPKTGIDPHWFNQAIQRYWTLIESHGIPIARVSQDDAIADPDHHWGPAYYHYIPETYQAQLEAITALR